MSANTCGKRFKKPSARLTADNNTAQPALPSHVALIQAQRAFAAVETIQMNGCLTAMQNQDVNNSELDSVTAPSKPDTSVTTSRVGSPALLTANSDAESSDNEVPPTVAAKKKRKRVQRNSGMSLYHAYVHPLMIILPR
jgi:hypothetical protein